MDRVCAENGITTSPSLLSNTTTETTHKVLLTIDNSAFENTMTEREKVNL